MILTYFLELWNKAPEKLKPKTIKGASTPLPRSMTIGEGEWDSIIAFYFALFLLIISISCMCGIFKFKLQDSVYLGNEVVNQILSYSDVELYITIIF